jgi:hypothetical protein
LAFGKSVHKANGVPLNVPEVAQPLPKRLGEGIGGRGGAQHPDEWDFSPLLRLSG